MLNVYLFCQYSGTVQIKAHDMYYRTSKKRIIHIIKFNMLYFSF